MPLDPQAQAVLDRMVAAGIRPAHTLTIEEARQALAATHALAGEPEPVQRVENRVMPGPGGDLPLRLYTPSGSGPFPTLVFFHGGGWIRGSLDTHDALCRSLANQAGCLIVSIDYRLSPEARFPAAVDDCYAATRWVADQAATFNGDPRRIAVGGDSAGGNLAAVVALLARDRGGPPLLYQVLIYPVTNYAFDTPSYHQNGTGYNLTRDAMIYYWSLYLGSEADGQNPLASPLKAPDLRGLPPALVITAEYDPLRDEGLAYADRLRAAGVPVVSTCYEGVFHGFLGLAALIDKGRQAIEEVAAGLRSAFAESPSRQPVG